MSEAPFDREEWAASAFCAVGYAALDFDPALASAEASFAAGRFIHELGRTDARATFSFWTVEAATCLRKMSAVEQSRLTKLAAIGARCWLSTVNPNSGERYERDRAAFRTALRQKLIGQI